MTNLATLAVPTPASKAPRIFAIVSDSVVGLVVVASVVVLVVRLATSFLEAPLIWGLSFWTALVSMLSLPALAVLYLSKPRVPLKERSALAASASWFGRVLWSAFVFSASIVIGSVAGIVASNAIQQGEDFSNGLGMVITSLSTMVLWSVLLSVGAAAYVVMGIRWCVDLGSIIAEDGGIHVRELVERRWTGPLSDTTKWSAFVDFLIEVGLTFVSRGALVVTLITVGLSFAPLIWSRA